jgi:hypothetical protein
MTTVQQAREALDYTLSHLIVITGLLPVYGGD